MTNKTGKRTPTEPRQGSLPLKVYVWTGVICALIGFGAVYATVGGTDNAGGTTAPAKATPQQTAAAPSPGASLPTGPGSNPLSVGEMAAFVFKSKPEPLPKVSFLDGEGKTRTLADWKGKVVLLNLWATWCVPCRKEMPGLDRLQQQLGSDKFEVVAVSIDRTGIEGARKFLQQIKVSKLAVLADPNARMANTLRAVGLPATLLLDREGLEIGRLVGPAEWDSDEAKALIQAALK